MHLRAGKDVRDAVVLCCVLSVGAHSDYTLFDAACDQAFQRPVYTYLQPAQLGPQDPGLARCTRSFTTAISSCSSIQARGGRIPKQLSVAKPQTASPRQGRPMSRRVDRAAVAVGARWGANDGF